MLEIIELYIQKLCPLMLGGHNFCRFFTHPLQSIGFLSVM